MARPRWLTKIDRAILEAAIADRARPPGRAPVHMYGVDGGSRTQIARSRG